MSTDLQAVIKSVAGADFSHRWWIEPPVRETCEALAEDFTLIAKKIANPDRRDDTMRRAGDPDFDLPLLMEQVEATGERLVRFAQVRPTVDAIGLARYVHDVMGDVDRSVGRIAAQFYLPAAPADPNEYGRAFGPYFWSTVTTDSVGTPHGPLQRTNGMLARRRAFVTQMNDAKNIVADRLQRGEPAPIGVHPLLTLIGVLRSANSVSRDMVTSPDRIDRRRLAKAENELYGALAANLAPPPASSQQIEVSYRRISEKAGE